MEALLQTENATLLQGRIRAHCNGGFLVSFEQQVIQAERAECCLHELAPGDLVLCHVPEAGEAFILGLLRRFDPARPARLNFEQGVSLTAANGEMVLNARRMRLAGREYLNLSSEELVMKSERQTVDSNTVSLQANDADLKIGVLRCALNVADWTADRICQQVNRLYRTVTDFEESRIGRLRQIVSKGFSLRAKQTEIVAEQRVKIDGKRIHLG